MMEDVVQRGEGARFFYGWIVIILAVFAVAIYALFSFAVFLPLMYFFIKNRPAEINVSADPDESDWFLRNRKLVSSVLATAAILGTLIYSPISELLAGRFGKQGAILISALFGIICLGADDEILCDDRRAGSVIT
jgi:ABC-type phosphate transport system permease subunit